jgi:DNA-binding NarL/FixJ family response regulator
LEIRVNKVWSRDTYLIAILLLVVGASAVDLYADLAHGASGQHILKEALVVALALVGISWLLRGLRRQRARIALLRDELEQARNAPTTASEYVLSARRQLGEVISKQFDEWGLSTSEKEVGLLLLKGLSLKEIASLRETLEKTVRQQASSIYKKAGVSGRHAFAAWFIEDFL